MVKLDDFSVNLLKEKYKKSSFEDIELRLIEIRHYLWLWFGIQR